MASRCLFVIDSQATLGQLQNQFGSGFFEGVRLASTARGALACVKAGLSYTTLEANVSTDGTVKYGVESFEHAFQFWNESDRWLWKQVPELQQTGIAPFRYNFYHLKLMLDPVFIRIQQWDAFLSASAFDRIVYHKPPQPVRAGIGSINLAAEILEKLVPRKFPAIHLEPVAVRHEDIPSRSVKTQLFHLFRRFKQKIRRLKVDLGAIGKSRFIVFSKGHDIEYLVPLLCKAGVYPEDLGHVRARPVSLQLGARFQNVLERFSVRRETREFLTFSGIDYGSLVSAAFEHFFIREIPTALNLYEATLQYLKRTSWDRKFAITGSILFDFAARVQMKACQDAGLKLITYQEGGGYGSAESIMYDYAEVLDGDLMLCYGAGAAEYYCEKGIVTKPLIPIGSAHQDVNFRKFEEQRAASQPTRISKVMYVGTLVQDDNNYFPNNGYTSTWYFELQKSILEQLIAFPLDVEVFVKLHPADRIGAEHLTQSVFERFCRIEGRLEDCLKDIDLFIVDFPSTSIMTCSQTGADIFLLVEKGSSGLSASNRKYYESRIHCFFDRWKMFEELRLVMSGQKVLETRNSRQYSRMYVTHLDDGRSAERAVEFLLAMRPI